MLRPGGPNSRTPAMVRSDHPTLRGRPSSALLLARRRRRVFGGRSLVGVGARGGAVVRWPGVAHRFLVLGASLLACARLLADDRPDTLCFLDVAVAGVGRLAVALCAALCGRRRVVDARDARRQASLAGQPADT